METKEANPIPYQLVRSDRKTIAIQMNADGTLTVRCPRRMGADAINRFVQSKSRWIEKHLAKKNAQPALPLFTDEELRGIAQQARIEIPKRVAHYAPLVGVSWGKITIRTQRTRWGSCNSKGNLNFNCLLMAAPPEVLDYVVVHELCHKKQMNHSPQFWAEVAKVLPDYKSRQVWLKENGSTLMARLPSVDR